MRDLLERWARLEPERCVQHTPDAAGVKGWSLKRFGMDIVLHETTLRVRLPEVQVYVQEQVTAREWYWRYSSRDHEAVVWPADNTFRGDWEARRVGQGEPAEALLSAYLAALEAEASA